MGPHGADLRNITQLDLLQAQRDAFTADVIRYGTTGEPVSLSGQVQAQKQTSLAFRIGGRLIDRRVSVGDTVSPGQLVARIEAQDVKNTLSSAEADLASAQATLVQARSNE